MATVIDRKFDTKNGAVIISVLDVLGNVTVHTGYVAGPQPIGDVSAWIAQACADADTHAAAIQAAFEAAGWAPDGN